MKDYIGVKVVAAEPMSRGEYNAYRGWKIQNPADEGYHSWMPLQKWCIVQQNIRNCMNRRMKTINKSNLSGKYIR